MGDAELTFFDQMERDRQAQAAELEKTRVVQENETKRAKLAARKDTKEFLAIVAGVLAAAVVAVTLCLVWFTDIGDDPNRPPKMSDAQIEQQREQKCIDTGGGWVPDDLIVSGDSGLCVYPGHTIQVKE